MTVLMAAANREPGYGGVMAYDYLENWAAIPGACEYNFYALSSQYGPSSPPVFAWGLTEDLADLTTVKWTTAQELAKSARVDRQGS